MNERQRLDSISLPPGFPSEEGPRPPAGAGFEQTAGLAELGVLAASLLHELRQPMFAIKAHAQLGAAEAGSEARGVQRLAHILEQVGHVEELLRYYGALFRAEPTDAMSVVDAHQPARAAAELLGHRARKVGADLKLEVGASPLRVRGRELALRQIVVNLLQNAFDAVEDVDLRTVVLRTSSEGGHVRIEIEDSGKGVPEAVRERVFEPFVTTKAPGRGTGLGLYIARRLAEEMGGTLRLEGSSRFVVELPVWTA